MKPASLPDPLDLVTHNRSVHDALAPLYEERHGEIFNPTEQRRIRDLLRSLLEGLGGAAPRALDFGAGTGNLTRQLLGLGARVVAADVSQGSLKELQALSGPQGALETSLLNGSDLAGMASDSFDLVATYSVLHHLPDYLAIIDEFVRVARPGGIIYLDHEVCPSYWEDDPRYQEYCEELARFQASTSDSFGRRVLKLLTRKGSWRYLWATLRLRSNPIADDGDIHVHKDDHIEWPAIRERLEPCCEIVSEEDYLVCRERQDPPVVWSRWSGRCVDMRRIVARKR